MNGMCLPDLTFPAIQYGQLEVPWDLRPLLYRGGAGATARSVSGLIAENKLGAPIADRIPLVEKLHAEISGLGSRASMYDAKNKLRFFYAWADQAGRSLTLASIEQDFLDWADHLLHRVRVKGKFKIISAVSYVSRVSGLISGVLELRLGLITKTRLYKHKNNKRGLGVRADRENLQEIVEFGRMLFDIVNAFSIHAIQGPPPVTIPFRSGHTIEHWYGIREPGRVKVLASVGEANFEQRERRLRSRQKWAADVSHRTRHSVINLRVQAEMLIFISQTSMNLAQVSGLRMGKFCYVSHLDGYRIHRVYKGRRGGEVEFEIFSEYREVFEAYLSWRQAMFPGQEDGLLFPRATQPGKKRPLHAKSYFDGIKRICSKIGVKYIGPRVLRKTRVNWLLRRLHDPQLTADIAQHSQETLLRSYAEPSHQTAAVEISRFFANSDPAIAMPGPGICVEAVPTEAQNVPPEAPLPDCVSPAGCLFCEHQRDIDSEDHVWSLATYRHLKTIELARFRPPSNVSTPHPALAVIDRVTAKLKHLEASSEVRALWVREALARIDEGECHPKWGGFVALLEARVCP